MATSLIILLIITGVGAVDTRVPWPLTSTGGSGFYQVRDIYDNYVLATNSTNKLTVMDCTNAILGTDTPCVELFSVSGAAGPKLGGNNFGNKALLIPKYGESDAWFIAASVNVGQINTYYCTRAGGEWNCTGAGELKTGGNSDPFSFVKHDTIPGFFAYYPGNQATVKRPIIVAGRCEGAANRCAVAMVMTDFQADCLSVANASACFKGRDAFSLGSLGFASPLLVAGFPAASRYRGLALLYDCTTFNANATTGGCIVQELINNPYTLPFSEIGPYQRFASSVAIEEYCGLYQLVIGVSGAATPLFAGIGNTLTNLYTGGAYVYSCNTGGGGGYTCEYIQTLDNSYYVANECNLVNQNFGVEIAMSYPNVFISSTEYCGGAGVVWQYECLSGSNCTSLDRNYIAAEYDEWPGDRYGFNLVAGGGEVVANAVFKAGPRETVVGFISDIGVMAGAASKGQKLKIKKVGKGGKRITC